MKPSTGDPSSPKIVVNPYTKAVASSSAFSVEAMAAELHRSQVALERLRLENKKYRERDEAANAPLSGGILAWSDAKAVRMMYLSNMCNGSMLISAAVGSFFIPGETAVSTLTRIILVAYMVFLGCLMLAMECNLYLIQEKVRLRFGWLFTYSGRAAFILL